MKKRDVLKLALMGLAVGTVMCGCSNSKKDMDDDESSSERSSCKGKSGCTGKSDCNGHSGCKGKNGCTGKSDCNGHSGCKGKSSMKSDSSDAMKAKREVASQPLTKQEKK